MGERIEGIEIDPLSNQESEVSYEYNMMPGFMKREMSMSGEQKVKLQPHDKSLKLVKEFMDKGKKKAVFLGT